SVELTKTLQRRYQHAESRGVDEADRRQVHRDLSGTAGDEAGEMLTQLGRGVDVELAGGADDRPAPVFGDRQLQCPWCFGHGPSLPQIRQNGRFPSPYPSAEEAAASVIGTSGSGPLHVSRRTSRRARTSR